MATISVRRTVLLLLFSPPVDGSGPQQLPHLSRAHLCYTDLRRQPSLYRPGLPRGRAEAAHRRALMYCQPLVKPSIT